MTESVITTIPQIRQVYYAAFGNFPAANAVKVGDLAYATDRLILYRSNGAAWQAITTYTQMEIVHKTASQVVNNSIVLVNDTHLLIPVEANEIWEFWLLLRLQTATVNPDFDFLFAIPAGGGIYKHPGSVVENESSPEVDGTVEMTTAIDNTIRHHLRRYLYIGGGNAGNIQLQWAQNVAVAEDTAVLEDSYIIAHRIL